MLTEHLRTVVEHLSSLPAEVQDRYATEIAVDLDGQEQQRIAAQRADPREKDLDTLLAEADEQSAKGEVCDLDALLERLDDA